MEASVSTASTCSSCFLKHAECVHGKLTEGWTDFALKGGNLH